MIRLCGVANLLQNLYWALLSGLAVIGFEVSAQQTPLQPRKPVQFQISKLAAHDGNEILLQDGSRWRTNMQLFGLPDTPLVIYGSNLRSGSNTLMLNGFSLSANYKAGELNARSGFQLTLLQNSADGKRLRLTDNLVASVLDSDRSFSRNWAANSEVIVSADFRTLLHLPSLQQVAVHISLTKAP